MVVLANQLVQLVIHVTADGGTVLSDCGNIAYRIVGVTVRSVVAVSYGANQMSACIGTAATCQVGISFGQQDRPCGFDNTLRRLDYRSYFQ